MSGEWSSDVCSSDLGVLLVPRMIKDESRIDISSDEFKRILEQLKIKK